MNFFFLFKNKRYIKLFIFFIVILSLLYFLFINYHSAISIFDFQLFSFGEKLELFFTSLFDLNRLGESFMLLLVILFILALALFLTLIVALYRNSKELGKGKSIFSVASVFVSILGLSCASCGIGLLTSVLSFFGVTYLINFFPWHGLELGYLGVIFLMISNYLLLKRVRSPFTC